MHARKLFAASAAIFALLLSTAALGHAGDWLGGQYWGQIGGCANCGGSMYGGVLPPGAIWVGEIGWGVGGGCNCQMHQGDIGPIMSDDEQPAVPRATSASQPRAQNISQRVSYIEPLAPTDREFRPQHDRVQIKTHTSQPERLQRAPIHIVSPDGSAGRMYR